MQSGLATGEQCDVALARLDRHCGFEDGCRPQAARPTQKNGRPIE